MDKVRVVAIGGGGFTHQSHPQLDQFCLDQVGARPRVGYIGAASIDMPERIERFYDRFAADASHLSHLPMTADGAEVSTWLADLDLLYVGGGDTEAMLALWHRQGWVQPLRTAARSGVVMAGVSAGGVCWFEGFLFNPAPDILKPLSGIGLIPGSACVHYSTEPLRKATYRDSVASGIMPAGYAMDDGAAIALDVGGPVAVCSAEPGAGVYRVAPDGAGGWAQEPVVT